MQYGFNQYTHLDAGLLQDSPGLYTIWPRLWHKHVSSDIINFLKPRQVNYSSVLSEETDCTPYRHEYIHGWCYYNSRPSRMYTLHTSYIYSIRCQQGNYLKNVLSVPYYANCRVRARITYQKVLKLSVKNIQGSELHQWKKGFFFPFTSQSPRLRRDGIILWVCSETICDLLEEGRQEAAPRIKPKRGLSPREVQQTHVEATHTSSMYLITVSTPEWYFGLDCK